MADQDLDALLADALEEYEAIEEEKEKETNEQSC